MIPMRANIVGPAECRRDAILPSRLAYTASSTAPADRLYNLLNLRFITEMRDGRTE
jgi:hypothetical protein